MLVGKNVQFRRFINLINNCYKIHLGINFIFSYNNNKVHIFFYNIKIDFINIFMFICVIRN